MKLTKYGPPIYLLFCILLGQSCSTQTQEKSTEKVEVSPSTTEMALRLDKIATTSDPWLNYHMNTLRAERLKGQLQMLPKGWKSAQKRFEIANELLNAGNTTECLDYMEEVRTFVEQSYPGVNDHTRDVYEWIALAYLRLGEQQNCIENHTSASCIVPLQPAGLHQIRNGSETAIIYLNKLLEVYPHDLQLQWLLNIANMTLGKYPEGVPEKWRVPESIFYPMDSQSVRFSNIATGLGVDTRGLAGGACMEDFNGDGFLDIFITSYGLKDQARLFLNTGTGFEDFTTQAGITGIVSGLNTLHADYDNDGDMDLLILRGAWLGAGGDHPNSLLQNDGNGHFSDVTEEAGLLSFHPTQTARWADFNGDGWLDLFIGNESKDLATQNPIIHPCELYVSNKDGTFKEVAAAAGVAITDFVKGVAVGDVNQDHLPDLYISVMGGNNMLFLNRDHGSHFEEITEKAQVAEPFFSFPCWFWDYDQDGWEDLLVLSYDLDKQDRVGAETMAEYMNYPFFSETPRLYRNLGNETFEEVSKKAEIRKTMFSMGSNFGDIDNDGRPDFYVGTGVPDLRAIVPNRMFKNNPNGTFSEVTMSGFAHIQKGHGVAFGDLDQDGDQDIYCVMGGAYEGDLANNLLFENPGNENNWVTIQLEGTKTNHCAIGTKVHLVVSDESGNLRDLYQTVSTGGSFGCNSLQLEFGLGDAVRIESMEIDWQNSTKQIFKNVPIRKYILVEEGRKKFKAETKKPIRFQMQHQHHHH